MVTAEAKSDTNGIMDFLQKYFNQGQQRPPLAARPEPPEDTTWLSRKLCWVRPRWAGIAIPAAVVHTLWWSYMLNQKG